MVSGSISLWTRGLWGGWGVLIRAVFCHTRPLSFGERGCHRFVGRLLRFFFLAVASDDAFYDCGNDAYYQAE